MSAREHEDWHQKTILGVSLKVVSSHRSIRSDETHK